MSLFARKTKQDFVKIQQELEAVTEKLKSMNASRCSHELKAEDYVYLQQLAEAFQNTAQK